MIWRTGFVHGEDEVRVTLDEREHVMSAKNAKLLGESLLRVHAALIREKALRASEAAQAKTKQENSRHQ